ncbi:MAG TPA: CheR family methyltransferase [Verrucomicrobiae bacterium]|nr:CheR family methyltransferase [Verrucomicrobiae bacterium]
MSEPEEKQFESLLVYLQQNRGFDFTGYKRPSLMRRVVRRMQTAAVATFADYTDYLEVHPEEFSQLFNTILINVTSFFRDPPAWTFLADTVVPKLLQEKNGDPIRVWSAGCASGEEAYSLAIVFAEAMGIEAFRERVKIYATDVDEEALNIARLATYSAKDLEAIEDPELRNKYFEPMNSRFCFRPELRRAIIFGRHDLVQDAPISRIDLLSCRNTLMYFNAEAQSRILARLHFALNPGGCLFLGRAELLLTHSQLFTPLDLKCRIFSKVNQTDGREGIRGVLPVVNREAAAQAQASDKLKDLVLDEAPLPRIVVDANGVVVLANQRARVLFSLNRMDIGRPLQDLEISYRPADVRSLLEQAYSDKRSVTLTSVPRHFPDGQSQYLDIAVTPLYDELKRPLGASISFTDVSRYFKLNEELQHAREEIMTANEELQSSNEELETTNEELQSSNEELQTTNEELQSTNEELETMNEEMQSTNEELQTVNDELRLLTDQVNTTNAFLKSVLASLDSGAVVVNQDFNVLVWNHRAEDLWGLRSDEAVGKSLLNLDIGLPMDQLRAVVRASLAGEATDGALVLDATNRRGKAIKCRISCSTLLTEKKGPQGAIILMEEEAL